MDIEEDPRNITNTKGKIFVFASMFLSKKIRKDIFIFYSFIYFLKQSKDLKQTNVSDLNSFYKEIELDLRRLHSDNQYVSEFIQILIKRRIPLELPLAFLNSLREDMVVNEYKTFSDLKGYMYGASYSVGVMIAYILGIEYRYYSSAGELGDAFFFTNILRNINVDIDRGKTYIPNEFILKAGYSREELKRKIYNEKYIYLYKLLINKNKQMYNKSSKYTGRIKSFKTRVAVKVAIMLYERLLLKIEKEKYNVFEKTIHASVLDKIQACVLVFFLSFKS